MSTRDIHVVVVGISAAGIRAAKTIAEFAKGGYPNLHITMIDKNEYHYHAIGAPRALVDKEFGTTLLFPLKNLLTSFEANRASPKHTFLQASLTAVNANNTITVSTGETIRFNYLVLATGTTSSLPAKLQGSTTEDAAACLHKVHDAVKEAKSILIIGGGAVGVESAGEIATNYPDKKVTLVHAADRLLPANFQKGLSNGAVDKLGKVGVKVVLNEKVVLPEGVQFDHQVRPLTLQSKSGSTYESDLQILATGGRPSAQYIESLETEAGAELRDGNGAIKVRATLQLDSDKFPNIFVPGDVNSLPYTAKFTTKADGQGKVAAENITRLVQAGFDKKESKKVLENVPLKEWSDPMTAIIVPIGRKLGVFQGFGFAFGSSWFPNLISSQLKGKDYFRWLKAKEFPAAA